MAGWGNKTVKKVGIAKTREGTVYHRKADEIAAENKAKAEQQQREDDMKKWERGCAYFNKYATMVGDGPCMRGARWGGFNMYSYGLRCEGKEDCEWYHSVRN